MELKPGYKQTEVGVIPEDWDVKRLGEIGKVVRGGSPRPAGDPKFFDGDFIPWLTVAALTNIPDHQLEVRHTETRLTEEGSKRSRTLQPETVIIANSGATLGIAKVSTIKCCANDGVAAIIDQHVGEKAFVCHCINAQTQRLREVVATGNGQPNLNTGLIKEIAIPWPPQTEQAAIAECISDLDKLLRYLEDAVVKKQRLKQAAMQELLTGKRRLPGFEGEWEERKLGDLADPQKQWSFTGGPFGSNLQAEDYSEDGVRIIQLQNIGDGVFMGSHEVFTSNEKANELLSCNAFPGDIILSKMGDPVARACMAPPGEERYLMCSDGIRLAVDPERFDPYFMLSQINAPEFREKANSAGTGSTRKRIGLKELRGLSLKCPPTKQEQIDIAMVLREIDQGISKIEEQASKMQELKRGMMQQLLTGKIRLT